MRTLALLALLTLAGCAVRATAHPATFQGILFYGRSTDCAGQPLPPQLQPVMMSKATPPAPPPPLCTSLEVGAASYKDTITALGSALAAMLPFLF